MQDDASVSRKAPAFTLLRCHEPWRPLSLFGASHLSAFTCPCPGPRSVHTISFLKDCESLSLWSLQSCREGQFHKRFSLAGIDWDWADTNTIAAINLTFTTPSGVAVYAASAHFESSSMHFEMILRILRVFYGIPPIKCSGSESQSVLLSFRLLALKSWTSHRLDEEKSETTSATSRATWILRHATEKQRP